MFSLVSTLVIECLLMDKGGLWGKPLQAVIGHLASEMPRAMEKKWTLQHS